MPHYYTEGLNCKWDIIRETPSSQKFRVESEDGDFAIDIHYTPSKVLTVNIVFEGEGVSKSILTPLMEDIEKFALTRCDYAVIDYTLAETKKLHDGNYSIDEKRREIFRKTM